ncbi:MAG: 8-oxo-dGTP diphosphatase MutT [Candidatus Eremiobacteraeota bacterium]|nr:8-oxo-dGTP diphosphatase MutT [Candidatus Eremiobacteraeota bacterium]
MKKDVTAAIIEKEGRVLIARRKHGFHLQYKWEFPGGKIEQGETPECCLARELKEEFGIESTIGEFVCRSEYDYGDRTIELLAFRVTHVAGDFHLDSHEEIQWVFPQDMAGFDFAEADKPIVEKLLQESEKAPESRDKKAM